MAARMEGSVVGTQSPRRRPAVFLIWLACFYTAWASLLTFGSFWGRAADHWPIAVAMAAGSYVAGSTPMGGGTIGFPILVLLFDQPANIGRNFSFAVQSIGMTSASIFIFAMRRPVDWRWLRAAMLGSLVGTPLGLAFIAPFAPDLFVKSLFAVIWASFGLMTFVKVRELATHSGIVPYPDRMVRETGFLIGLFGGSCFAALTGVGIDMLIYCVMVLLCRSDLRIAIPTSVVLMAFTSLVGVASNGVLEMIDPVRYAIDPEVFGNWIAAAPIVALGAPLGAYMVNIIPRVPTLYFVSVLCIIQFVWTLAETRMAFGWMALSVASVLICNALFHLLYAAGARAEARLAPPVSPSPDAAAESSPAEAL